MITHPHPFKELRMLVGVPQKTFAMYAEVSRPTIINLESGLYETIPLKAHQTLSNLVYWTGTIPERVLRGRSLQDAHREWQLAKRRDTDLSDWPLLTFQEIVARFPNQHAACLALCIPTATMHHALTRHDLPVLVRDALRDAGYRYSQWGA